LSNINKPTIRRRRCPICNKLDYPSNMIYAPVLIQEGVLFVNDHEYIPNFSVKMRYVHKECYDNEYAPMGSMRALEELKKKMTGQTTLDLFF